MSLRGPALSHVDDRHDRANRSGSLYPPDQRLRR
jgi:hypothetical protein